MDKKLIDLIDVLILKRLRSYQALCSKANIDSIETEIEDLKKEIIFYVNSSTIQIPKNKT